MMTDAFTNYELGNKNYQAIFNRQVASLDVNQNIAAEQQKVQGTLGILTGTVGGGAAGAMAGAKAGPYGAIAGAAVGTIGGAATTITGYLKDKEWLAEQQADARSYMIVSSLVTMCGCALRSSQSSHSSRVTPLSTPTALRFLVLMIRLVLQRS